MPRVVHFELAADDPERAIAFYANVFGWNFNKWESPDPDTHYWLIMTGEGVPGIDGGLSYRQENMPSVVNTIDVPSLDDAVSAVEANGGMVLQGKMTIPGVGYLAYCADTEGNVFGMMQADPNAMPG